MAVKCTKIIEAMETLAPLYLAESWDNVGLQIGDLDRSVHKILVSLELTNEVIDEAIAKDIDMIIVHHPLIFKGIKSIVWNHAEGKMIQRLIQRGIQLYCSHTNLDVAVGGTNDYIAQLLNLEDIRPLKITRTTKYYKLVVFVPKSHVDIVREAMCSFGAGHIGKYSHCTFQSEGMGTFKPLEGANPFIGSCNHLEHVEESRIETIVSDDKLSTVLSEMISAHPYEEVAYDIIPLQHEAEHYGIGRVGVLEEPAHLFVLCEEIKNKLGMSHIRIIGDVNRIVKKIGLCTGSGAEYISDAFKLGCDCYITGDVKYHEAQYALQLGMTVIDAGHYETENIACQLIVDYLKQASASRQFDVELLTSTTYINPFQVL